jgi:hypothetical protein
MPLHEGSDAQPSLKQTILNLQLIPANHKKDHTFIITSQLFHLIPYPI